MANIPQIIREAEGSRLRSAYQRIKLTAGITQTDIAIECGWRNASTFNRLLAGKSALTLEALTKLATILRVTPAAISPRLIQDDSFGVESRKARQLPVSLVKAVTKGSWGEPFLTSQRFNYFTSDATAFALTFDPGVAPAVLAGWVVIIEPGRQAQTQDRVIVRHGVGKYSYGRVVGQPEDGALAVDVEGRGVVLTVPTRCMLISALSRLAELT